MVGEGDEPIEPRYLADPAESAPAAVERRLDRVQSGPAPDALVLECGGLGEDVESAVRDLRQITGRGPVHRAGLRQGAPVVRRVARVSRGTVAPSVRSCSSRAPARSRSRGRRAGRVWVSC